MGATTRAGQLTGPLRDRFGILLKLEPYSPRELGRIRRSLAAAPPENEKILFLHYPPIFGQQVIPEFFDAMKEYGVKQCFYGHLHGGAIPLAYQGEFFGVDCRLISADYLKFCPIKIR